MDKPGKQCRGNLSQTQKGKQRVPSLTPSLKDAALPEGKQSSASLRLRKGRAEQTGSTASTG